MQVEILYVDGCPTFAVLLPRLERLLADRGLSRDLELRRVASGEEATRLRFLGSPTLRIDGVDVEPGAAGRSDYGIQCRLYAAAGGLAGIPPDELIIAALERGAQ